jgi:quercetin dioxygenase-like cupin family protein
MAKLKIVTESETTWDERVPGVEQRIYHQGGDAQPELFEVWVHGEFESPQHAHTEDEIIYILEGSMRLGAKVCEPGTALHIPGNALYRFQTGPDGCRFLNFRPVQAGTIFKDEFLARRSEGLEQKRSSAKS